MLLTLVCMATLTLGAPFNDTLDRFQIDLPKGWEFAPQPGDVSGVAFHRELEGVPANSRVQILDLGPAASMEALAEQMIKQLQGRPGYRMLHRLEAEVAGQPAILHRYVVYLNNDPKWAKIAEDSIIVAGGKGYVLHVETLAEAFANFESEFTHLAKSLRIAGAIVPRQGPEAVLVGVWEMVGAEDTLLVLRADGSFKLGEARGHFRLRGRKLWMGVGDGSEMFFWRLDPASGELALTSKQFDGDIRYRRQQSTPKEPLLGNWASASHSVKFEAGGAVKLGSKHGSYTIERQGVVVLKLGKRGKSTRLRYAIDAEVLTLKGGVFGKGHKLRRTR